MGHRVGTHPKQQHRVAILHHQSRGLEKSDLTDEQRYRRRTNCQDPLKTIKFDDTYLHRPFANARNIDEIGGGRRDLISMRHRRNHFADATMKTKTKF